MKNDSITIDQNSRDAVMSVIDDELLFFHFIISAQEQEHALPNLTDFLYKKVGNVWLKCPYGSEVAEQKYAKANKQAEKSAFRQVISNLREEYEDRQVYNLAGVCMELLVSETAKREKKLVDLVQANFVKTCISMLKIIASMKNRQAKQRKIDEAIESTFYVPHTMTDKAKKIMVAAAVKGRNKFKILPALPTLQQVMPICKIYTNSSDLKQYKSIIKTGILLKTVKKMPSVDASNASELKNEISSKKLEAMMKLILDQEGDDYELDDDDIRNNVDVQALEKMRKAGDPMIEGMDQALTKIKQSGSVPVFSLTYSSEYTYCVLFDLHQIVNENCYPFGRTHPTIDWVYTASLIQDPSNEAGLRETEEGLSKRLGGYRMLDEASVSANTANKTMIGCFESVLTKKTYPANVTACMTSAGDLIRSISNEVTLMCHNKNSLESLKERVTQTKYKLDVIIASAQMYKDKMIKESIANALGYMELLESENSDPKAAILKHYGIEPPKTNISCETVLAAFDPMFVSYCVAIQRSYATLLVSPDSSAKSWLYREINESKLVPTSRMAIILELISDPKHDQQLSFLFPDPDTKEPIKTLLKEIHQEILSGADARRFGIDIDQMIGEAELNVMYSDLEAGMNEFGDLGDLIAKAQEDEEKRFNFDSILQKRPPPKEPPGRILEEPDADVRKIISLLSTDSSDRLQRTYCEAIIGFLTPIRDQNGVTLRSLIFASLAAIQICGGETKKDLEYLKENSEVSVDPNYVASIDFRLLKYVKRHDPYRDTALDAALEILRDYSQQLKDLERLPTRLTPSTLIKVTITNNASPVSIGKVATRSTSANKKKSKGPRPQEPSRQDHGIKKFK